MTHWADRDLRLAVSRGLIRGDPNGQLRPDHPTTRAEMAVVANRLYDLTQDSFERLIAQAEPAVVKVVNERTNGIGSGTSIGGGLVLTNAHVVVNHDGTTNWQYGIHWTTWDQGYAMAEVVHVEEAMDLAVLRVGITNRDLMPVLPLGTVGAVRKAEPVAAIGSPVGLINSVSVGIVSCLDRALSLQLRPGVTVTLPDLIQTDAAINPGNSGGALINLRGELIGVPSAKLVHLALEGLGFCIGLASIETVLRQAGIRLAPKPVMHRPEYERYGWNLTPARHTMLGLPRYLIVHHEGGTQAEGSSALDLHRHHFRKEGWAAIGYHAVIERDGRIAEGRPLWAVGAHAARKGGPDYNPESLGVCLVGNLDQVVPTEAQMTSLVAWLRWVKLLYPRAHVFGHHELPGLATRCPGRHLNLDALRELLGKEE